MWGFSGFLIQCSHNAFISIVLKYFLPFTKASHNALQAAIPLAPCLEATSQTSWQ